MTEVRAFHPLEQRRPGDALDPVYKALRELDESASIIHGRVVEHTFALGSAGWEHPEHFLGRRYAGAILIGWSAPAAAVITVGSPPATVTLGEDPDSVFSAYGSAATTGTAYFWVF